MVNNNSIMMLTNWQVIKLMPFSTHSYGKIEIMHLTQYNTTTTKNKRKGREKVSNYLRLVRLFCIVRSVFLSLTISGCASNTTTRFTFYSAFLQIIPRQHSDEGSLRLSFCFVLKKLDFFKYSLSLTCERQHFNWRVLLI